MSGAVAEDRAAWLRQRSRGIGGSDAAAVLGISPWKSRFSLWAEKTGLADSAVEETEAMEWGRRLEPLIGEKYAEVTGRKVLHCENQVRVHKTMPFMLGSLDFEIVEDARGPGVLEVKTLGIHRSDEWKEEPPIQYSVQLQHYMSVTGAQWGSFAALIGGQKFVWVDVPRNDGFIEALEAECAEFWKSVETGEAPPVDGTDSTTETLKKLYPRDSGASVELPSEAEIWWMQAQKCKEELKVLESAKREAENKLKAAIGDASEAFVIGGPRFSYRLQQRASYVAEASEFRVLREMKGQKR